VEREAGSRQETLLLILILGVGAALRLYGLDWDGGHWLHPDERQIYFVTLGLSWPSSLAQALSPASPLNPHFFAYGSWPLYLLKIVAALLSPFWPLLRDPDNLHLAGRPLAALFDLGTVYLTYHLARTLWPQRRGRGRAVGALIAAVLVSLSVLHIQLAHFYTVDPLLTFWVMLTLNLAAGVTHGAGRGRQAALAVALGLALATKVSAAPLALVIVAAYTAANEQRPAGDTAPGSSLSRRLAPARPIALTFAVAGLVFFAVQPYALIDWRAFVDDTLRESQIAWGALDVPYTRQYAGTLPYLYTMRQTALWALALPLGLAAWAGLAAALYRWLRRALWADTMLLVWAGPYLAITGLLHTRYLRYMLPLIPVLCLLAIRLGADLWQRLGPGLRSRLLAIGAGFLGLAALAYALAFQTIYATPHTWIAASEWLYEQVPAGSTLAVEEWDVALPLPLDIDGQARRIEEYDVRTLALYAEPDGSAKWQGLATDLAESEYVILASRRLYGSIPRSPERYPLTTRYYELLLSGKLGFELAAEFSRGPTWLNPRIAPLPGAVPGIFYPDESFVVYDHPRTLVFRNAAHLSAEDLLRRLASP